MSGFLQIFLYLVILVFIILIFACFIRAVKGPTVADRIVGINMIGSFSIIIIVILAVLMKEGWLADIAAIYAMISFLAVVVLTKVYIGIYKEKNSKNE